MEELWWQKIDFFLSMCCLLVPTQQNCPHLFICNNMNLTPIQPLWESLWKHTKVHQKLKFPQFRSERFCKKLTKKRCFSDEKCHYFWPPSKFLIPFPLSFWKEKNLLVEAKGSTLLTDEFCDFPNGRPQGTFWWRRRNRSSSRSNQWLVTNHVFQE